MDECLPLWQGEVANSSHLDSGRKGQAESVRRILGFSAQADRFQVLWLELPRTKSHRVLAVSIFGR